MEQRKRKSSILIVYFLCSVLLIIFDQWTKWLAVTHLKGKEAFVLIDGVFELSYLENTGMAWGLLEGGRVLFLVGSVLVCLLIVYGLVMAPATKRFRIFRIVLTVLFAGAVGNFIDRLLHGYVVDFFSFCLIDFPVFNVADCYVVTAGILFVVLFLFYYKDEEFSVFVPKRWRKEKEESQKDGEESE